MEQISYERRVYESVDDESLSQVVSEKRFQAVIG